MGIPFSPRLTIVVLLAAASLAVAAPKEKGLITVSRSSFVPEIDASLAKVLSGIALQVRLSDELVMAVGSLNGVSIAADHDEVGSTVLEVRIVRVALAKDDPSDGKPALVIHARARLVQPSDGRSLYDQRLEFRGAKHPLSLWLADEGAVTQQEIDRGLAEFAAKAADDVFMIYDASPAPKNPARLPYAENRSNPLVSPRFPNDAGPDRIDVSGYPEEMRQSYKIFRVKCAACHTIARPINAQYLELSPQGLEQARKEDTEIFKDPRVTMPGDKIWKRYVKRMMSKPGCPVSGDGRRIWEFLAYDSRQRKMGAQGAAWRALRLKLVEDHRKSNPEEYRKLFPETTR